MARKAKKPKQVRALKSAIIQEWKDFQEGEAAIANGYSLHLLQTDHAQFVEAELKRKLEPDEFPPIPYGQSRIVIVDKRTHAILLSKGSIRSLDPIPEKYR